jgi:hypothetical protein
MVVLDVNNDGGVDFPEFFATMNSTSAMYARRPAPARRGGAGADGAARRRGR